MSFGNGRGRTNPNQVAYSFKVKTKDLPAPVFEVQKRLADGKWEKQPETASSVNGNIIAIDARENEYQGSNIQSVQITMEDGDEIYFVTVPFSFLGRSLFNTILTLDPASLNNIGISLYQSKPNAKTGKTYASAALYQNDEFVKSWKFTREEQPEIKKVLFKGKENSDTTDLDNFFFEKIAEFGKAVKKARSAGRPFTPSAKQETKDAAPAPAAAPKATRKSATKKAEAPAPAEDADDQQPDDQVPF